MYLNSFIRISVFIPIDKQNKIHPPPTQPKQLILKSTMLRSIFGCTLLLLCSITQSSVNAFVVVPEKKGMKSYGCSSSNQRLETFIVNHPSYYSSTELKMGFLDNIQKSFKSLFMRADASHILIKVRNRKMDDM